MRSIIKFAIVLAIVISTLLSCNSNYESDYEKEMVVDLYAVFNYVEMDFGDYGKITIELDSENAPITVKHFRKLVASGFYDGLTIFRAQEGFVIQGGENENVTLTPIVGEFSSNGYENNISHTRGVISMARTNDPDSATSQFFIVLDDKAKTSLDGRYAGFGKVIEGMDVVDKIAVVLFPYAVDSMGFVGDEHAITIVDAKLALSPQFSIK